MDEEEEEALKELGATAGDDEDDDEDEEEHKEDEPVNKEYLASALHFSDDRLLDSENNAVMMGWETPIMERSAAVMCPCEGRDVLNIGFGLGIIDTILQKYHPRSHTIVEAHPDGSLPPSFFLPCSPCDFKQTDDCCCGCKQCTASCSSTGGTRSRACAFCLGAGRT